MCGHTYVELEQNGLLVGLKCTISTAVDGDMSAYLCGTEITDFSVMLTFVTLLIKQSLPALDLQLQNVPFSTSALRKVDFLRELNFNYIFSKPYPFRPI